MNIFHRNLQTCLNKSHIAFKSFQRIKMVSPQNYTLKLLLQELKIMVSQIIVKNLIKRFVTTICESYQPEELF